LRPPQCEATAVEHVDADAGLPGGALQTRLALWSSRTTWLWLSLLALELIVENDEAAARATEPTRRGEDARRRDLSDLAMLRR
jgi:hypothetical protein